MTIAGGACAKTQSRSFTASYVNIENDDAGDLEINAPGINSGGSGTRASANTSGPDFTWA